MGRRAAGRAAGRFLQLLAILTCSVPSSSIGGLGDGERGIHTVGADTVSAGTECSELRSRLDELAARHREATSMRDAWRRRALEAEHLLARHGTSSVQLERLRTLSQPPHHFASTAAPEINSDDHGAGSDFLAVLSDLLRPLANFSLLLEISLLMMWVLPVPKDFYHEQFHGQLAELIALLTQQFQLRLCLWFLVVSGALMSIRDGMLVQSLRHTSEAAQKDIVEQLLHDRDLFGALALSSMIVACVSLHSAAKVRRLHLQRAERERKMKKQKPDTPRNVWTALITGKETGVAPFFRSFSADGINPDIRSSSPTVDLLREAISPPEFAGDSPMSLGKTSPSPQHSPGAGRSGRKVIQPTESFKDLLETASRASPCLASASSKSKTASWTSRCLEWAYSLRMFAFFQGKPRKTAWAHTDDGTPINQGNLCAALERAAAYVGSSIDDDNSKKNSTGIRDPADAFIHRLMTLFKGVSVLLFAPQIAGVCVCIFIAVVTSRVMMWLSERIKWTPSAETKARLGTLLKFAGCLMFVFHLAGAAMCLGMSMVICVALIRNFDEREHDPEGTDLAAKEDDASSKGSAQSSEATVVSVKVQMPTASGLHQRRHLDSFKKRDGELNKEHDWVGSARGDSTRVGSPFVRTLSM